VVLTDFAAVTTVSALMPTFFPTVAFETPLTLLSAACTFFEQPEAHRSPDTSRVTVFSSAAMTSAAPPMPTTAGAAMAPEERTAKAAIMVILVFMVIGREITLHE